MKRYSRYRTHCRNYWHKGRSYGLKEKLARLTSEQGIYRSRKGLLFGVCRGIAEHLNISVFWLRFFTFILFLFTGFWPVGVMYIVAGLILKIEPVSPLHNEKDEEFYDTYTRSRESAIQRIKRKFENIERRIQRMEHTVTSREFNWK